MIQTDTLSKRDSLLREFYAIYSHAGTDSMRTPQAQPRLQPRLWQGDLFALASRPLCSRTETPDSQLLCFSSGYALVRAGYGAEPVCGVLPSPFCLFCVSKFVSRLEKMNWKNHRFSNLSGRRRATCLAETALGRTDLDWSLPIISDSRPIPF